MNTSKDNYENTWFNHTWAFIAVLFLSSWSMWRVSCLPKKSFGSSLVCMIELGTTEPDSLIDTWTSEHMVLLRPRMTCTTQSTLANKSKRSATRHSTELKQTPSLLLLWDTLQITLLYARRSTYSYNQLQIEKLYTWANSNWEYLLNSHMCLQIFCSRQISPLPWAYDSPQTYLDTCTTCWSSTNNQVRRDAPQQ